MTQSMKYGDENDGFEISINNKDKLIHIKEWGFWKDDHAKAFRSKFSEAIKSVSSQGPKTKQLWKMLVDIDAYKVQSELVQEVQKSVFDLAKKNGLVKIAHVIYPNSLTRIQMERLFKEWGISSVTFHPDEESALKWLSGKEA